MSTITTKDGTQIYYKDWGQGPVVLFSHGWPLNGDAWDGQMLFLAQNGFRVIAHDRRGHGRSSQSSSGNDMDTYADDLAELIETLDLRDITLVGHSTGGGEVTRYIGRHGTARVAKAVLISAVPPILMKTDANPEGIPVDVFDGLRQSLARDRSQFYREFAVPFFGANRDGADVPQSLLDQFWSWCIQVGLKNAYECVAAFSATDFTEDLKQFDVPTLVLHGEDDQIVPVGHHRAPLGAHHPRRQGHLLPGCAARHHRNTPGSGQRRPARVHPELTGHDHGSARSSRPTTDRRVS